MVGQGFATGMRQVADLDEQSVLRRKLQRAPGIVAQGKSGVERSWWVVLARAARDAMALGLDVQRIDQSRISLAELLDMPTERSLLAVLEGPGDGLGLMAVSAPLLAAMTEMQTIGRVSALAPAMRKPSRTDAAMVAGFVDAALAGLEVSLADDADLIWAGGFRYASFLDDPRPLGLLLEDISYRVLVAEVSVAGGTRSGQILVALPADGRGNRPQTVSTAMPEAVASRAFTESFSMQLEGAACELRAVIHRMKCPVSDVIGLQIGAILPLQLASIEKVGFEGLDGQRIAEGRLGQNRGMRAVRLSPPAQASMASIQNNADIIDAQKVALAG